MVRFNLPWDLEEDILSRVPATYLGRLQFTCKRWNALFKDPEFITKHMDKAVKQNLVITWSNFRVYSLGINLNEVQNNIASDPSIEFTTKLSRNLSHESEEINIVRVFPCNGLLLCSTKESNMTYKLVVVNPCTGQARWIKPTSVYDRVDRFALGYVNNKENSYDESYKILRFYGEYQQNLLEIFELKSNSWRRVHANIPPNVHRSSSKRCVSLRGKTYWLSHFLNDINILSFDFATERFRSLCLPLPLTLSMKFSNTLALSVVKEEKLSVLRLNFVTRQMELWVSDKIDTETSWSKTFGFDLHSHFDLRCQTRFVNFFIDKDKKVIVCCGTKQDYKKNMIYSFGKHGFRKLGFYTNQSNPYSWFLYSYVPSLVSLHPTM